MSWVPPDRIAGHLGVMMAVAHPGQYAERRPRKPINQVGGIAIIEPRHPDAPSGTVVASRSSMDPPQATDVTTRPYSK